jgi:hypothetical protein
MTPEQKLEILNQSLEKAAEELGDINRLVLSRYYEAYPEAEKAFNRLSFENRATRSRMENSMIDSVLYCFMTWFEHPKEVDLTLQGAALQHTETKIPLTIVIGLLETTADVILSTIDRDDTDARSIWQELQTNLIEIIDQSTVTLV